MSLLRILGLAEGGRPAPAADDPDTETMHRIAARLDQLDPAQARYLAAFACILGRVAHADSSFSDAETTKMLEIVQGLGHLSEAQAALVVEIAQNRVQQVGTTENFLVTRRFREIATTEQRVELLDCVFAVSAADDSISATEEGQAGQIAKELGLTRAEFVAARVAYRQHLASLRHLRRASGPAPAP